MRIDLLSILSGSLACDARCPDCISKMTYPCGMDYTLPELNLDAFYETCEFARYHGVENAMITGKGEPLLFPRRISDYMRILNQYDFKKIDLQTNGIKLGEYPGMYDGDLKDWFDHGMDTLAVSVAHFDKEKNRQFYLPHKKEYPDLAETVKFLHKPSRKFTVRFAVSLLKGYIDTPEKVLELIERSYEMGVDQLTIRNIDRPVESICPKTAKFVDDNKLSNEQMKEIKEKLDERGKVVREMSYGAAIYDIDGKNICLTNCMTFDETLEEVRQLIFFQDGVVRYDWQRPEAILDLKIWRPKK